MFARFDELGRTVLHKFDSTCVLGGVDYIRAEPIEA
jgi:hypothetical protein